MIDRVLTIGGAAVSLALGGWGAHEYLQRNFAPLDAVVVAGAKVDYILDQQIEALVAQIAILERKANKTPEELSQLEYLRKRLEYMRNVQRGGTK